MSDFWQIINGWTGFWQFVFFILIAGGVLTCIERIFYAMAVLRNGWPKQD